MEIEKKDGAYTPVHAFIIAGAVFFCLVYVWHNYLTEWLSDDLALIILGSGFLGIIVYLGLIFERGSRLLAKRMTEEVYASREWFRGIYDYSPTPYVLLSLDNRIRQPNKAALRLYGKTAEELYDNPFTSLFIEEEKSNAEQCLEYFKRSQPVVDKEMRVRGKDGRTRWVLLSMFALDHAGSEKRHGLIAFVDITERKEIERAKTEFVSLASHQLRSPLATIKWYMEALLSGAQGALNEKQVRYVEKVYRSNQTMIELVGLLLNVSRIEMGALAIVPEEVSLRKVTDFVIEGLSLPIKQKSITIQKKYEDGESFSTDRKLIHIVVENLFSNAVKYTPEGGTVTVNIWEKGGSTKIAVSDTGCGIPVDAQDKIFTKLFRAENAKVADPGGSGLGLYLTRAIVKALNGGIEFASEEGKGTTFTVTIRPL